MKKERNWERVFTDIREDPNRVKIGSTIRILTDNDLDIVGKEFIIRDIQNGDFKLVKSNNDTFWYFNGITNNSYEIVPDMNDLLYKLDRLEKRYSKKVRL